MSEHATSVNIGLLVYFVWQAYQRSLRTGKASPSLPQSNIVRDDLVAGKNGKKYRRVMRVDRNALDNTVTTTVTFTETTTGGVCVICFSSSNTKVDKAHTSAVTYYTRSILVP